MNNPTDKINWPDNAALQQMFWAMPITQIGRHLGVSARTVRKMAQQLGLPVPGPGYWQKKRTHLSGPGNQTNNEG